MAVQAARPELVEEPGCQRPQLRPQGLDRVGGCISCQAGRSQAFDGGMCLSQRGRLGVDGTRSLVAEQVPDHCREHECQTRVHPRNGHDVEGVREPTEAGIGVGNDNRRGLVGPVDGNLLGHVISPRTHHSGGTDKHQRLSRQVDVLLVLGGVSGDGLVTEF